MPRQELCVSCDRAPVGLPQETSFRDPDERAGFELFAVGRRGPVMAIGRRSECSPSGVVARAGVSLVASVALFVRVVHVRVGRAAFTAAVRMSSLGDSCRSL
jgi:hypothetical protein